MGLLKRDHIQSILALPNISAEWHALFGKLPGMEEVSSLFNEFGPVQMDIIMQHSQLIDGAVDAVKIW